MFNWILEYGKVLIIYLFIMYFWPSVVLRNYLNNKGLAFRFSFCTTFMILLLNTVVLMFGIVGLLNQWIIRLLFYGPLLYIFTSWIYRNRLKAIFIKYLFTDICSLKQLFIEILDRIVLTFKRFCRKLLNRMRPHLMLYIILTVAIAYGMIYFSYGAFHERYYGTSDVYVHHSWIDMLLEGKIYGAGIYPEGMHSFVYAMNTLFGVEVYSCLLFLGSIHISAFLLSVYLFFKEIFPWKYSGTFVVVLYLILRLDSAVHVDGMARLQWTIPQEFALFTVFLCATYLLRFLRNASAKRFRWKKWEFLQDENLLIFMMALAVSIAVHFYVTIMAFFLCLAIGVFFIVSVFAKRKFLPLVFAIFCGVVIAVTPMLAALATGIEFQGSIGWAMNVIAESQQAIENGIDDSPAPTVNPHWEIIETEPDTPEEKQTETEKTTRWLKKFYEGSFISLYREGKALFLACCTLSGALLGIICHIVFVIKRKTGVGEDPFCGYLFLCTAVLIFMILFAAPQIGLLEIVQTNRLGTMTHILTIATVLIPLDLIMTLISKRGRRLVMDICATVLLVGISVSIFVLGEYHSHLYYFITRYPASVEVTCKIIQKMAPDSYTVVSPVDELYQIKNYGYHEEWTRFVCEVTGETYTLPTEYVFIYIEKQPLEYAHSHFLDGPSWIAKEEYLALIDEPIGSQSPNVLHAEISEEEANRDIYISQAHENYTDLMRRTVINSKMYLWAERFQKLYPYQLTTVYEDDAFVCYMFRQNPARLLELAIMD